MPSGARAPRRSACPIPTLPPPRKNSSPELARDGALELHTLSHGDRIIAVFGALPGAERLSGLFIGHDGDPEIARSSPGEIMVQAVVADAIARGFAEFDLGVGEARYKDEACEIVEPLFDSAFAVTLKGRLAAWAFLAARRAKRAVEALAALEGSACAAAPARRPLRRLNAQATRSAAAASPLFKPTTTISSSATAARASASAASSRAGAAASARTATPSRAASAGGERQS